MAKEPCVVCGVETAIGSVFYSDRHRIGEGRGEPTYLCAECLARIRSVRPRQRLTEKQVRDFVMNGSMAAIAWSNRGG